MLSEHLHPKFLSLVLARLFHGFGIEGAMKCSVLLGKNMLLIIPALYIEDAQSCSDGGPSHPLSLRQDQFNTKATFASLGRLMR